MTVILFKIAMVIFIVGSLLDMGLRLNPRDALKGLRNFRFVLYTLLWGFVFGPTLAYVITLILPLDSPYAMGLLLIGMTPCTSLLPVMVNRAKGDLGYTAAFMLLASGATIIFMPFAVPFMLKGLTVSAWTIAKPLLMFILLPMVVGIAILHGSATLTSVIQPFVKKATGIAAIAVIILCLLIYGEGLLGVAGSFAIAAQLIFFSLMITSSYWFSFGLPHEQKIVLSIGMSTRNLGAALAPLFSIAEIDQRAIIMVVLVLPMMVISALLATKWFGRLAARDK